MGLLLESYCKKNQLERKIQRFTATQLETGDTEVSFAVLCDGAFPFCSCPQRGYVFSLGT